MSSIDTKILIKELLVLKNKAENDILLLENLKDNLPPGYSAPGEYDCFLLKGKIAAFDQIIKRLKEHSCSLKKRPKI